MDIRGTSSTSYTPPAASGRSGSAESEAETRKTAADSVQERKEAERNAAMRQVAQKQAAAHQSAHRDSHSKVDIRV
ncbi:hypothetical protein [Govanella unica]|uniref:Uncharacterized protein n=1 Tax=Govanella unica TaxID=2975056 RepID=A0A9X3TY31_9PROT|nr:hypothetical protein [Govania unica]MDA5193778.1 hypothetical protein [Govania unica]